MTIQRCPLSIQGVITDGFKEVGGKSNVLVILPNRNEKWISNVTNPYLEGRHQTSITYEDVRALVRGGAVSFVHDLAGLAGMHAEPGAAAEGSSPVSLMGLVGKMFAESGEAGAIMATAAADGVIDKREAAEILKELQDVRRAVDELIAEAKRIAGS